MLFHLIYVSRAARDIRSTAIDEILKTSRTRNAPLGITGMLLFADDSFIQVLEGGKAAVEDVFGSIERDNRHSGVTVLVRENIEERHFAGWSMGFERVTDVSRLDLSDIFLINSGALRERLRMATHEVKSFIYGFVEITHR